jgi:hypothetical protein
MSASSRVERHTQRRIREVEMGICRYLSRAIALTLAAALFVTSFPIGTARAGLVTTERVLDERSAASDRDRLLAILLRDDVRQQMVALGVNRDEAVARLASLSDEEIQQISGQIDDLPAGQGFIGGVLIVAGVVFIALIITDLLGVTNLFGFINPIL